MLMAFLAGFVCAFVGSIPIAGPTAVVIVERALNHQTRAAFEIAVGASLAELGYSTLAFLGMTAFLSRFPRLVLASRVLGAVILLGLGLYLALARRKPPPDPGVAVKKKATLGAMVALGLVMTGVNPTLLASWSAVVTVLHSTGTLRVVPLDAFPFGIGVAIGSTAWFALMLALLRHFRRKLSETTLGRIVKAIGWILVVCGIVLSVELIRAHL
jgi:threonine/homoserine/homoserine lactone efflux protein